MRKMKAQERVGDVKAQGGSFTPFRQSVSKADVSPIGEDGGGRVTKANAGKYGPSKILTPNRQSASKADVSPIGEDGGGR